MQKKIIYLNIAGFTISIIFTLTLEDLPYEQKYIQMVKNYYRHFLITNHSKKVDFTIEIEYAYSLRLIKDKVPNKDKVFIIFYEKLSSKKIRTFYHLSGSQLQIIIRQLTHELLSRHKGFILHASASKINNKAVLFMGNSGAGKSTIMTMLSDDFEPLGDDSVILKKEGGQFYCYSSSARERNDWFIKRRERIELGAVIFIRKNKLTKMKQINNKQKILDNITKQLYSEQNDVTRQMQNMIEFVNKYDDFYQLDFSLDKNNLNKLLFTSF